MRRTRSLRDLFAQIARYAGRLAGVVVHLNDTYLIEERVQHQLPGFPRLIATVKALRRHVRRCCNEDRLLVVHSGDFLAPSRLAKADKGRTMVELLNRAGVDFCVLGNHEFDHGEAELTARLRDAHFRVLIANARAPAGLPVNGVALWPSRAHPCVALTGIVASSVQAAFKGSWRFTAAEEALRAFVAATPQAAFHLVLTHATRDEDRRMRKAIDDSPRCYLLGGHDHDISWIEHDALPLVMKNLANLQTVRVLLLLAGGETALSTVHRAYDSLKERSGAEPRDTRANRRALLETSAVCDVLVLRPWIERRDSRIAVRPPKLQTLTAYHFAQEDDLVPGALVRRLEGVPYHADVVSRVLRREDLEPALRIDAAHVAAALKRARLAPGRRVLRDFRAEAGRPLEAREAEVRSGPTDFGVIVSECVRLEGRAGVAILNSGMFRSDALLPARLRECDLFDTFLYDAPDAVVVLETVSTALIDDLLCEARQRVGQGAYPQVSDARPPNGVPCRLAIARYLITAGTNIDTCYLDVFARHMNQERAQASADLQVANALTFSVIDAVRRHVATVGYPSLAATSVARDEASQFVHLARLTSLAFRRSMGKRRLTHAQWNSEFRRLLSRDGPVADARLQSARDDLRRHLRDVAARNPGAMLARLQSLREEVAAHRARFADGLDYHSIFDSAATGIAGWVP